MTALDRSVLAYFEAVFVNARGSCGHDDPWRSGGDLRGRFGGHVMDSVARLVARGDLRDEGDGTYRLVTLREKTAAKRGPGAEEFADLLAVNEREAR